MKTYIIGLLAMSTFIVSCQKEQVKIPDLLENQVKVAEGTLSDGKQVTLYSPDSLITGYNPIFIKITQNGKAVLPETLTLATLMDMGTMQHSSPSLGPVLISGTTYYEAGAVLTMPSATKAWSLILKVGGEELIFKVNVKQAETKTAATFTTEGGDKYVLALYPYKNFKVGMNDFSLIVFKKETAMKFVPVTGLNVEFYPYMTSMDHGSPNNVNPKDAGNGFYNGKVNFTMSGDWRFHFKIKSGTDVLFDDAALDIVF